MRVLVTGHHGYIGTVLAARFAAAGHAVQGLDSDLFADCVHGADPSPLPSARVDLRDVTSDHLDGVDAVVHLAALSNDPLGDLAPQATYDINHHASVRLARLAREAGAQRFLYASSCSVYGASSAQDLLDEDAPLCPVTPYAESKIRVEADLHALADEDFSPVYLRNATVFGWSPRLRADLVLNDLVGRAHLTGEVRVLSDGTPWRPIVHVEDVAAAFLAALEAPREAVHDRAFNVGSEPENHRVRDLATIAQDAVPGSRVVITGEHGADPRSYRVDFSRIRAALPAFVPAWSAARGAEQLARAYRTHGLDAGHFATRFKRMPRLTELRARGEVTEDLRPAVAASHLPPG